ncbi:hypothetical protein Cgig2_022773 [Carnegiea gigantea]|uniref:WIT1/2 N-terminal helical bundle domain-containing protein n=1 Tax=Carnegiea gigantea TaxID=171969 RepID=A0A9Q1KCU4_9CARY|nr:hypothetical protein Cgig2_022773 [Carnegiea gigantea]
MDGQIVNGVCDNDSESRSILLSEGLSHGENLDILRELVTRLDIELAYSAEKLVNLDLFTAIVSLGESELEELSAGNNKISEAKIEKALVFDLSFGYLDSEVTELGNFLTVLRNKICDAKQNVYLCRQSDPLRGKLHALESSWKHLQEQLSEMKRQLANLRRTLSAAGLANNEELEGLGSELQAAKRQISILRMLEKSLASELEFEKQLVESKEREEALESTLLLTNSILSNAEAFLEAALEKLLEAENSSHIFMGIAKEMTFRLQILQLNLHCSVQREEQLKAKLLCTNEVLSNMKAFSEDALGKLLEAEHSSEIFVSILREMMSHLQVLQLNLQCSVQREEQLKSKLSCANGVASEMEAYSEVALERLLEAEHFSAIFPAVIKEMMSHLQFLQFNLQGAVQREQELKSRLLLTNEATSNLEAFSEDALERLLEAQHSAEIFKGISKQVMSHLEILQFNLDFSVQREQELQSKLSLTNEAVSNLEAFSELALERLLEAEHRAEIFMGIAKEMMSRLQILQFNLHCSVRRERDLESKLQRSLEQLKEKEMVLTKAENKCEEMKQSFEEKGTLLEKKVKALEEKLQSSESELQVMKASYEASQEQLSLMEDAVQSLREHVFMAESRAHLAEAKFSALTEENVELREEVGFLKGVDINGERISLLEKQVRDLEMQLQNARMSAEASTEQQNMLYTAIWDMETLIEELKSKVSKAESRAESTEEQYLALAETNVELNEEISCLKAENEKLKESLKEANRKNVARVKEINNGAKLITEMVMQLAVERERIQKQA